MASVKKIEITAVGIHNADYMTLLYPQMLALTSPTSRIRRLRPRSLFLYQAHAVALHILIPVMLSLNLGGPRLPWGIRVCLTQSCMANDWVVPQNESISLPSMSIPTISQSFNAVKPYLWATWLKKLETSSINMYQLSSCFTFPGTGLRDMTDKCGCLRL
jgi:hypothetical protein